MSGEQHKSLWFTILIGMILGIAAGWSASSQGIIPATLADQIMPWIALPGQLFMALLKMIIVPLVMTSIILGLVNAGDLLFLKKMSLRLIPYFIMTTAIAITIGLSLTHFIQPGAALQGSEVNTTVTLSQQASDALASLTVPDRIMNALPTNPDRAMLERIMLQIVIFALLIGVACLQMKPDTTKGFIDLCRFGQEASMIVVNWAMAFAPLAVFSLMAKVIADMGLGALANVGLYAACVVGGLFIMALVYGVFIRVLAGRSIYMFFRDIREAQLIAFSTSSSSATMPVSMRCATQNAKLPPRIVGFTIPLGATINMDGTALYQATAALFLCQVYGIDLSMAEMVLLLLTTIGASIGTPAMPGVGLVVLATILTGIGVPAQGLALILGVDRLLDMCRTTINVTGDLTASAVMSRWMGGSNPAAEVKK